jgi:hypothetical protein
MVNKLHSLRRQEGALVSDLFKSVKEIVMQLTTTGEIIQDAMVIHIILNALPSSYETFVQTIINPKHAMGIHDETNGLYKINATTQVSKMNSIRINFESELWHCHLGHLHYQGLDTLSRKGRVVGLPSIHVVKHICNSCMLGKQHLEPVLNHNNTRAKEVNELIHSNLCGPLPHASLSRSRYFLTFIDDFS